MGRRSYGTYNGSKGDIFLMEFWLVVNFGRLGLCKRICVLIEGSKGEDLMELLTFEGLHELKYTY